MNLTPFQVSTLEEIEQRSDFTNFVKRHSDSNSEGIDLREENCPERNAGPIMMLWYDDSGVLHAWRVGQKRIIRKATSDDWRSNTAIVPPC